MRHRDRLTPRNRMRIEAAMALDDTNGSRAAFLLERILSIDSLDVDALNGLAFTYHRDGWQMGKSTDEIIAAYDKVLRVDPLSIRARTSRASLALLAEDSAKLAHAVESLRAEDTTSAYVLGTLGALRAITATDIEVDSELRSLAAQPAPVVNTVVRELQVHRPELADRYYGELLDNSRPVTHQAIGSNSRGLLWFAEGRMAGADSLLQAGFFEGLRPVVNRVFTAAALAGVGDADLAARAAVEMAEFVPVDSIQAFIATKPYRIWAMAWAIGAYHATFGDTTDARIWQQAIADLPIDRTWWNWTGSLAADIGARVAVRQGDLETAEREAREAYDLWLIHMNGHGAAHPEPAMRFHLAEILDARGATEQAEWLYRSFVPPHGWVSFYTPRASFELGRIEEERGNVDEALDHYLRAIRLWERGDPEVVGEWLARAQEGLSRLGGERASS
jgi:tetratricopeptide (TPR) repeat protein